MHLCCPFFSFEFLLDKCIFFLTTGAIHMSKLGSPPAGGIICCPNQWELHGTVLITNTLQNEQEASIRWTQGQLLLLPLGEGSRTRLHGYGQTQRSA